MRGSQEGRGNLPGDIFSDQFNGTYANKGTDPNWTDVSYRASWSESGGYCHETKTGYSEWLTTTNNMGIQLILDTSIKGINLTTGNVGVDLRRTTALSPYNDGFIFVRYYPSTNEWKILEWWGGMWNLVGSYIGLSINNVERTVRVIISATNTIELIVDSNSIINGSLTITPPASEGHAGLGVWKEDADYNYFDLYSLPAAGGVIDTSIVDTDIVDVG